MIIMLNDDYHYRLIEENGGEFYRESSIFLNKMNNQWELYQRNCDGSSVVRLSEKAVREYLREWAKYPRARFWNQVEYRSID